jgi:hypothetical protein
MPSTKTSATHPQPTVRSRPIADIADLRQSADVTEKIGPTNRIEGIGCAWALLGINTVLIGLLTASFVQGPYSTNEQELWYRYGSLGFFMAGVVLPAIVLFSVRRSRWLVIASTAWMLLALLGFVWFGMMSSGGV